MNTINAFAFLDETGNLSVNHPDRYFAVGTILHPWPDEMIIKLHILNMLNNVQKDAKVSWLLLIISKSR
jgi:hypothetical protein